MTPTRSAVRSGGYFPFLLLFVPLAVLVWAFWPTLTELFRVWYSDPQYSHGFLVPVFAVFLLWMPASISRKTPSGPPGGMA